MVEWDGEDGSYSTVHQKYVIEPCDPSEGEHIKVKEGGTKNVYSGVVLKKGMYITLLYIAQPIILLWQLYKDQRLQ